MVDSFGNLLDRARAGDRAAMGCLLEPHLSTLTAFVRLNIHDAVARRESAVDVVQSVCGDVIEDIRSFRSDDERAFKAWLFRAVGHKLANKNDFHRAARRDVLKEHPAPAKSALDDTVLISSYRRVATPSEDAVAREEIERFETAFDALPRNYRDVIALVSLAGFTYREAGEILGRTEDAVRQTLHRARARLATLLD